VIKERRQDRAIALFLDGLLAGRSQELAGLVIANGRRPAFTAVGLWALDAFDRVVSDCVLFAEIFEQ
jgi:hypothetical protein